MLRPLKTPFDRNFQLLTSDFFLIKKYFYQYKKAVFGTALHKRHFLSVFFGTALHKQAKKDVFLGRHKLIAIHTHNKQAQLFRQGID
jgi:hypothetical protein